MKPQKHYPLQNKNTFGFTSNAEYYLQSNSLAHLDEALDWAHRRSLPVFPLGGGSNVVLTRDIKGLVIHQTSTQFSPIHEDENSLLLRVSAGSNWHQLVQYCVAKEYYGIENLALIPGTAGAAPIQNIGAYGVELADVLSWVECIEIDSRQHFCLSSQECQFAYRDSAFKNQLKNRFIITAIVLKLSKRKVFNLNYTALAQALAHIPDKQLTLTKVFDAVCAIRSSKLPNPLEIGNAGSFFTNPVISTQHLKAIEAASSGRVPYHQIDETRAKIPAAWLVDSAGWKGHCYKHVGVHDKQAIVLVNHGNGDGEEILTLAKLISDDIYARYQIRLDIEPVIV